MFYSVDILGKHGVLAPIWIAAHFDNRLTKVDIAKVDIEQAIYSIHDENMPVFALRTAGTILLGIVRLYVKQNRFLGEECRTFFYRLDAENMYSGADNARKRMSARNITIKLDLDRLCRTEDVSTVDLSSQLLSDVTFAEKSALNASFFENVVDIDDMSQEEERGVSFEDELVSAVAVSSIPDGDMSHVLGGDAGSFAEDELLENVQKNYKTQKIAIDREIDTKRPRAAERIKLPRDIFAMPTWIPVLPGDREVVRAPADRSIEIGRETSVLDRSADIFSRVLDDNEDLFEGVLDNDLEPEGEVQSSDTIHTDYAILDMFSGGEYVFDSHMETQSRYRRAKAFYSILSLASRSEISVDQKVMFGPVYCRIAVSENRNAAV